jgi:lysylphosphatidylglycerol synthase-like protein
VASNGPAEEGGARAARPGRYTASGVLIATGGGALFAWLVWRIGPSEIWSGFRQIGWGLVWIVLLGGMRFATRAAAWTLCIEPPHRLAFTDAFSAVVCGDALGNATPLGPIVSEPAKVAYVRGRLPLATALTALAIENVLYTLSVAAMIAAGTIALLFSFDVPLRLREFSEAAIAGIVVLFGVAAWVAWRRPALVSGRLSTWLRPGETSAARSRPDRIRALEQEVYTFATRRRSVVVPIVALELAFHVLGVAETHITLWLIREQPPPLLTSFVLETVNRLITVGFKFVPFQVGVGEASAAFFTQLLGLGSASGLTLSIVRKTRMGVWALIGTILLVRQGLTTRRIMEDPELSARADR